MCPPVDSSLNLRVELTISIVTTNVALLSEHLLHGGIIASEESEAVGVVHLLGLALARQLLLLRQSLRVGTLEPSDLVFARRRDRLLTEAWTAKQRWVLFDDLILDTVAV